MVCLVIAEHYSDGGSNAVRLTIPCENRRNTFNIVFIRNFNLTSNDNLDTPKYVATGEKDIPRVWFPYIGNYRFKTILLSLLLLLLL